jgi:hypothetical protein
MSYFDPNGLYRITSANRTSSLLLNTSSNFSKKEPNAALQQTWTKSGLKTVATYTMGPISNDSAQLWTFLPVGNGYWTIHNYVNNQPDKQNPKNSVDYQVWCLERNGIYLQYGERKKQNQAKQQWWIESTEDGEGKWVIQAEAKATFGSVPQRLDIKQGTNQALVTNGVQNPSGQAFDSENTFWEIEYVKPTVAAKASKL